MRRCPCPLIRLVDVTTWDPAPFRDQVQQVLDAFLDRRAAAFRADIARLWKAWSGVNLDAMTPVYIMDSSTAISRDSRLCSLTTWR